MAHDRYRWDYNEESGQIVNWNRKWLVPHCITIPNPDVIRQKQQLFLAPCEDNNPAQSWIVSNGMIKVRGNQAVCIMWNLQDRTRLWSIPCGEHIFSQLV